MFEGACVYITSNKLPDLAKNDDPTNFDWTAVEARTIFYKVTKGKKDRGSGSFPINAPVLAHIF